MKSRFSTIDIIAMVNELQSFIGMRVNQVYDIDNKTYLIRLNRYEEKVLLLIESGVRFHTTDFEWPKNPSPSGFSMKMRKHLKNKRLEKLSQLGIDRIIDLQFGINEAAYHVILELYDRGNIVFTDYEYTILNILRPRTTGCEDVKFIVREKYPVESASLNTEHFNRDKICSALNGAKDGESLKKILMPLVAFGPALLDHVLLKNDFPKNSAINKGFEVPADIHRLFLCIEEADALLQDIGKKCDGYIFHKVEKSGESQEIMTNIEFHPYLFQQFSSMKFTQYPSFNKAVDDYFSGMEGQKIDLKAFQKEKEALKKLHNVKKDHEQRLVKLHESQTNNIAMAQLIEMNSELVDKAITVIRSAIANQISWSDIQDIIKEAQFEGDPVAKSIKKLKLDINHFTVLLNPVIESDDEEAPKAEMVDIDLGCSAYANARKYYDLKRAHAKKEQKTLESSEKAFKNAEKKTKQALKEVAVTTSITKARKVMWFEKFLWFLSSENYLVIAGRDVQQNELLVKRYMKSNDLYVHADLHGASSLIIKNPTGSQIPPKTLNEAGIMAVCNSTAWDAKIVTSAWWVYSNQVSKTAPSGEYLTTGSFMIRGKKNYLSPANLIMGFGFMFKLDEESIENHLNERCERSETESEYAVSEVSGTATHEDAKSEISDETSEKGNDDSDQEEVDNDQEEVDNKSDKSSSSESEKECDETSTKQDLSEDNSEDESSKGEEEQSEQNFDFPDTEIKLNVLSESASNAKGRETKACDSGIIFQEHRKRVKKQISIDTKNVQVNHANERMNLQKRGHKGKMKKIKEKYKYQDEEERLLRMKILGSAGQNKEEKKCKNKKQKHPTPIVKPSKNPKDSLHFIEKSEENTIIEVKDSGVSQNPLKEENIKKIQENDASDDEIDEDDQILDEIKLLNSLTGCPCLEDILLFAVPVCGPYSSLLSYKYKVKIIPGGNRRGKAAKTALQIFLHEKTATNREKDLLRSVKDQDISRNLPGKIKISAASYKKVK